MAGTPNESLQVDIKDQVQSELNVNAIKRRIKHLEKAYERNKRKDASYANSVMHDIQRQR